MKNSSEVNSDNVFISRRDTGQLLLVFMHNNIHEQLGV